ncbi:MAG: DHH family phosphoesterase [Oscillospiraceae bacterium]|nr:DHH family phosphoesterase [Oscillospiraceae bacterium]
MTVKETAAWLAARDNFLLLTHVRPDGDTIGSAAALCRALRAMGKRACLLRNDGITATYAPYADGLWAEEGYVPETVVSVDIAALSLFIDAAQPYRDRVDLAIDHHSSQEFFAAETCLVSECAACGEIVYAIIRELTPITPEIALPLYVAVSTDCGGFQYANTTADTHRIAAELMALVDVTAVNKALFRTKSFVRLKMESRMVEEMTLHFDNRVVVMSIPLSLRREMQATEADIEELSSLAAMVEGTDCGVTLRELREGVVKISIRTTPAMDAGAICAQLGGGGHRGAAGATVEGTMESAKAAVLQAVAAYMEA